MKTAVLAAPRGTFKGGSYIGTLANGGAVLAPFHDCASKVPRRCRASSTRWRQQHQSGKIEPATKSPV